MYLTEFVKELSIVPEADHIIGILIGGGVFMENGIIMVFVTSRINLANEKNALLDMV
jgi:hypothetical protein